MLCSLTCLHAADSSTLLSQSHISPRPSATSYPPAPAPRAPPRDHCPHPSLQPAWSRRPPTPPAGLRPGLTLGLQRASSILPTRRTKAGQSLAAPALKPSSHPPSLTLPPLRLAPLILTLAPHLPNNRPYGFRARPAVASPRPSSSSPRQTMSLRLFANSAKLCSEPRQDGPSPRRYGLSSWGNLV